MILFVRFPFQCDLKVLDYQKNSTCVRLIRQDIETYLGTDQFVLYCNGKPLRDTDAIINESNLQVTFSLPGGKGGFGSMLRAIGAQIEKTTNREACRDLSGRRLRDINEEQRLKKWIAKEAEREADKIRRRKERIERLKSKAPHKFFDFEYEKEISELPNRINEALSEGLQKAKQPSKRPLETSEKPLKKTWLADDFPISSSDSELEESSSTTGAGPSKKPKLAQASSSSYDSMSESSQSLPGSSKDSCFILDESSVSCELKTNLTEEKNEENNALSHDNNTDRQTNDTVDTDVTFISDSKVTDSKENKMDANVNDVITSDAKISQSGESKMESNLKEVGKDNEKDGIIQSKLYDTSARKESEQKDDSPVELDDYQSVSELEALGLDRLKSALMARGLKCGGTLTDRAQRLWKVRGLQPHEYPANLLAKSKK